MSNRIRSHRELEVYQLAYQSAMKIFEESKSFPKVETYSLTDQLRRSSRSVCANIAEGFRKRRYPKHFVSKLSDAEAEAAETQVWIDFCRDCKYFSPDKHKLFIQQYEYILGKLVRMAAAPEQWKF